MVLHENNIILFDTRNINKQIFVKYLNLDKNEIINTNIFRNDNYNYKYFKNIEINNNIINLLGFKEDLDDESIIIDDIKYIDNSLGKKQTYVSDIELSVLENTNNSENTNSISNENLGPNLGFKTRSVYENLISGAIVNVIQHTDNNYYYIFNGNTTFHSNSYYLTTGRYIIKNVPQEHPIAILNNNNPLITYYGFSYNNKNPRLFK